MLLAIAWIVTLVYLALCILVVINIYSILYRLGKWRTLPLLLYYTTAFFSIYMRETINIFYAGLSHSWFNLFVLIQPLFKIGCAVMQSWTIFEISLLLRLELKRLPYTERIDNLITWGRYIVAFLIFCDILGFGIYTFVTYDPPYDSSHT